MKTRFWQKTLSAFLSLAVLLSFTAAFPALRPAAATVAQASMTLRVEGAGKTLLPTTTVSFDPGDPSTNLITITEKALDQAKIPYTAKYGNTYLSSIGGESEGDLQSAGHYTGWSGVYNGAAADSGMASVHPENGSSAVVYFGDMGDTHVPSVTLSPKYPVEGQKVTLTVSTSYYDWSTSATVDEKVAGAAVTVDGTAYTTDENGAVVFTAPAAGSCTLNVSKDVAGACPLLVRTGDFALHIYQAGQAPQDTPAGIVTVPVTTSLLSPSGTVSSAASTTYNGVPVAFEDGTQVTGPAGWDGVISLAQRENASSVNIPDGFAKMAVKLGSSSGRLSFSKPVTLTLPGQAGQNACYFDESGVFHAIAKYDTASAAAAGVAANGTACYDSGLDLVILTTHFSTFASYSAAPSVSAASVKEAASGAESYLLSAGAADWSTFALARAGAAVPASFAQAALDNLSQNPDGFANPTALERTILVLKALGKNPQDIGGRNLIAELATYANLEKTGLNGAVYGLLALDSGGYTLPAGAKWDAAKLTAAVLAAQHADGSFSLSGGLAGDPDVTAMAVTALAPQLADASVKAAVGKAVGWLAASETANGGWLSTSGGQAVETSESVAQTVIALASVGIDPATDQRFVKNGKSPLSDLMSFRSGSGFSHLAGGGTDLLATQQALMALNAYERYQAGSPDLYDLTAGSAVISPAAGGAAPQTAVPNPATGAPAFPAGSAAVLLVVSASGLALLRLAPRHGAKPRG